MDIKRYKSHDRLLLAVDCIIFGFDSKQIRILLIKRDFEPEKGKGSLMGGFVHKDENVDTAAARVLRQLQNLYEAIYETPLDTRNFTKKMLSLNVIKKLNEKEKKSSRKGAFYHVFDRVNYKRLCEGIKFI